MKFLQINQLFTTSKDPDSIDILKASPKAQVIAGLFTLGVIYYVFDVFLGLEEFYAPSTPWHLFVLVGCVGVFGCYKMLSNDKLETKDSVTMALLFGIGVGLVSYPLSIRAHIWADDGGLVEYTYELNAERQWVSSDSHAPVLVFDQRASFWDQYHAGDHKTFELRHVSFGYTQINMKPIYDEQMKFFQIN